jgi:CheY-like chemotaxis protein/anti-sigma regulatory factor (Ser/Thr protein kinase)
MKNDDPSWLCAELGLPVLDETADGLVSNPAAQTALEEARSEGNGADEPAGLAASAARIMGIDADDDALMDALATARRGEHGRAEVGPNLRGQKWRVLATPLGDGARVRLTCAPREAGPGADRGWVEVAAAVSHEVANAVGSIRGWAELALHGDDATVDVRDALTLIRSASRNAEHAARSMLRLARGQADADEPDVLDLSEFSSELMSLLALGAREARVTLQSSIEPGLHVRATRAQLFTMLFNLLKNAIEACKHGGLVSLSASGGADSVHVSVRDTGAGMDAHARQRLFERYFTTKATGTGLGLALVKSAADASGARISVDSELGRGTVFQLLLLRAHEAAPSREPSWPSPPGDDTLSQQVSARVLLVDDDHALREMLATALSLRGATVTSARNAEEALALSGPFDLALIDMMLEGCRGDELLATLRKRGSVNAAMLVTGTVQKPRLVPGGEPDDWVRKPFELAHLVERMRRTLERHRMLHQASLGVRA